MGCPTPLGSDEKVEFLRLRWSSSNKSKAPTVLLEVFNLSPPFFTQCSTRPREVSSQVIAIAIEDALKAEMKELERHRRQT